VKNLIPKNQGFLLEGGISMKRILILLLAISVMPTVLLDGVKAQSAKATTAIHASDKNQDGEIDLEEYHMRLTDVYFLVDADKDGKLTLVEIRKYAVDMDSKKFKAADTDGDGKLSMGEYHNALDEDFDAADKDQDGELDRNEVERMMTGS